MRSILDARPYKTFTVQITFGGGWRNEPVKMRGGMRKSLEETLKAVLNSLPSWFDGRYVMDAEFSSIVVWGLSEDQEEVLRIARILVSDYPPLYEDLGIGVEIAVFSGGVRRAVVDEFSSYDLPRSGRPALVQKPRRFLSLRELSRPQKHFLVYLYTREGGELFLEISRRGDRLHYGMRIPRLSIDSLESAVKAYKAWVLGRAESTREACQILTIMNVYSKDEVGIDDLTEDVERLKIADFASAVDTLTSISERLSG